LSKKSKDMKDSGGRKVLTTVMLTRKEITYLDRKIDKSIPERASRSALIRFLIKECEDKKLV